uniref:Uncharacterized protein n=1 Tax=Lactuca sativa TaxID=4236 RepID=A0A9R1W713_LACSA|nr:hypothetical protein LSAT_V11C300107430 [Lactuca sativa]
MLDLGFCFGFPCKNIVYAIWNKIENGESAPDVEDWVHPCYTLSTWRAMYLNEIDPVNGHLVVRPKRKRKRGVDEPNSQPIKLSKKFLTVTCLKCHNKGHNSRTCKWQGGIGQVRAKGKTRGNRKGVANSAK